MGPEGTSLNWRGREPGRCICVWNPLAGAAAPYLLNHVSDGEQLLCGVSRLRQGGVVIVAGDHGAEPGVVIGTCTAAEEEPALNSDT